MLDKLKKNCSMHAYYSIVLVFSIVLAGSGIHVMWLEARRSADFKYLNDFTRHSYSIYCCVDLSGASVLGIHNPDGLARVTECSGRA